MSLIDDALRRIHDPTVKRTQSAPRGAPAPPAPAHSWSTTPPEPTPPPFASKRPAQQPLALTATTVAILGLSIALLIGGAVWFRRSPAPVPATSSPAPSEVAPQADAPGAHTVPASSLPRTPRGTAFVLSGVVEGAGEPYAVINGTILGVGEKIADATLIEIGDGAVRLRHIDGRETVLRAAR